MLAMEHHRAGRLDEAECIYLQLSTADRRDTEVIYLMGVLCCDLGLFEAGCRFLEEAIVIAPAFPEAHAQLIFALNGLADAQFASGRFEDAERTWAKALASGNNHPRTLQGLGRLALARGDPPTAEKYLVAALAGSTADADTLNWLGLA